jgi:hypothetical protein
MSEPPLEELLRGGVVTSDAPARERARLRLRAAIAQEQQHRSARGHRRIRVRLLAAVAILAMTLLVLQVFLPPGTVGPPESAASEIRRLGALASHQQPVEVGESEFVYQRFETRTREVTQLLTSGTSFALDVGASVESWLAPDGSGRVATTYHAVSFASVEDRRVWVEGGSPDIHESGEIVVQPYARSGLPFYPVDQLPTDPDALRAALASGDVIEPAPGDLNLLSTIGTVLSQQDLPGELRGALFEVAATVPGVAVEHDVQDPLGRPALAVSLVDDAGTTRLFFDPLDARFLGRSETFPAEKDRPGFVYSRAYVAMGVVEGIGDQPAA